MKPLPHATINRLMGLLETMGRTPGPDSVKSLAQTLQLDLEDLLPLLSAARLLRWVEVSGGRYDLTTEGRRVVDGDEPERKALFRGRIASLPLIEAILRRLAARERVPEADIADELAGTLDPGEVRRQIDTAASWGRYAEILDYDSDDRSFVRPSGREP